VALLELIVLSALHVARVLLVAVPPRSRELAPMMRATGELVSYAIDPMHPRAAFVNARAGGVLSCKWPVVVVDGESIAGEDELEELLIMLRRSTEYVANVLYIANRLPSNGEAELAFAWADDVIERGRRFGDRLRRRVQTLALAPWRCSMALRLEAERMGDRRLRVLRPLVGRAAEDEQCAGGPPGEEGY
jgi:hypothetical protein